MAVLATGAASAQGGRAGGGGAPGGGGGGRMPGGGMGMPGGGHHGGMGGPSGSSLPRSTPPTGNGVGPSISHGGLHLGPPARWWNDKKYASSVGLNSDQQKRMDAVFAQNRDALLAKYDTLQKASTKLEALTHAEHPDESALFAEIDHVAQSRADLERAYARMQLQIRAEMTPAQIDRLEGEQR